MHYTRIRKTEDIARNQQGEVQCGDNHWGPGSYYASAEFKNRPAAVVAFIDGQDPKYASLAFVCKKHLGTVKANITKGSYSFRDMRPVSDYNVTFEQAVADPAGTIKRICAAIAAEHAAQQQRNEVLQLERTRNSWDKYRGQYAANEGVEFMPFEAPDEFGRVYVTLKIGDEEGYGYRSISVRLTPAQVRKIVEFGGLWATNAERLTNEAVKP